MTLKVLRFLSLLFVALSLAPAMAHLLELPHKISLPAAEYLTVQQLYAGWALLGIVILGALLSTLGLLLVERMHGERISPTFLAFLCIVGAQIVFWVYTYPANVATHNWTMLPDNWMSLRSQWEYSHAVGAVLNLLALVALLIQVNLRKGGAYFEHGFITSRTANH
jgi:hypothetical protein